MEEKRKIATKAVIAQRKAVSKYSKTQGQIAVRMPKETREKIASYVAGTGESMAKFVVRACLGQIERDAQLREEGKTEK